MTIVERLKAAQAKTFPEYDQAVQRLERANAALDKAKAEVTAAAAAVNKYGENPRWLDCVINCLPEVIGEDAE